MLSLKILPSEFMLLLGLPCGVKDRQIFGVSEPQVTHGMRRHTKGVAESACQCGRQLRINPENHATTTG